MRASSFGNNQNQWSVLGTENSLRRKFFSPLYFNPQLNNKQSQDNIKLSRNTRAGISAVSVIGIVASHTWFFRSSLSFNPKSSFNSSGIKITQAKIDEINSISRASIGGNSYEKYVEFFNNYPQNSQVPSTPVELTSAINQTITEGKASFYEDRTNIFKTINNGLPSANQIKADKLIDNKEYDVFFKTIYNKPDMDSAAIQHNGLYPYNKIYASASQVDEVDAQLHIKSVAESKINQYLDKQFNPFDALSLGNKGAYGFLFFVQWAIAIASAIGIFNAQRALSKKNSSQVLNSRVLQQQSSYPNLGASNLTREDSPINTNISQEDLQATNSIIPLPSIISPEQIQQGNVNISLPDIKPSGNPIGSQNSGSLARGAQQATSKGLG